MASHFKLRDGGWGWVIVGSIFVIRFLTAAYGVAGIYFPFIMEEFRCSRSEASFVASLFLSLQRLTSPLVAALTIRFGVQSVVLTGNAVMAIAMVLARFAPNLIYLYIVLGVFGGLGLSLNYLPTMVIISQYFDKKNGMATAFGLAGNYVGYFILPFVVNFLNEQYGWHGALWISGGMALNSIPLPLLLRPLVSEQKHPSLAEEPTNEKLDNEDAFRSHFYLDMLFEERDEVYTTEPANITQENQERRHLLTPHFELLRKAKFSTFCIANLLICAVLYIPNVYTVTWGTELGYERELTTSYVALLGLGNLTGRIASGFFSDFIPSHRLTFFVALLAVLGVLTIILPFFVNRVILAILIFQFTTLCGSALILVNPVVAEMIEVAKRPTALGIVLAAQGIGILMGPPLLGLLPAYKVIFATSGGIALFVGLIMVISKVNQGKNSRL